MARFPNNQLTWVEGSQSNPGFKIEAEGTITCSDFSFAEFAAKKLAL
jgi:hypothetical protein